MANNYCTASFYIEVPDNKLKDLERVINKSIEKIENLFDYVGFDYEIDSTGVWVSSEDFNPEAAAEFTKDIVETLELEKSIIASWAYTCSKLRIDNFGGGAFLVRKGRPTEFIDAYTHMQDICDN